LNPIKLDGLHAHEKEVKENLKTNLKNELTFSSENVWYFWRIWKLRV